MTDDNTWDLTEEPIFTTKESWDRFNAYNDWMIKEYKRLRAIEKTLGLKLS